jgi:uncharacterized protein (PEP-CTERM system associated)
MKTPVSVLVYCKLHPAKSGFSRTALMLASTGVILLALPRHAHAANWTITPLLQFQEIYSDNIKLARPGSEQSAFVTAMNPGISVNRQSGRNMLNLNYRLQNLYNALGDNNLTTFNQLQLNANQVLVPDTFFLNARSSVSQQNLSNSQVANDNVSGSGNRVNVNTFVFSPTWTPHFGHYANGNVGLNFDTVTTDGGNASSSVAGISDTLTYGEFVRLNSGTAFKRISWNVAFNNSKDNRATGNDVSFQSSIATLRTYLNKYVNVFVQGGHSNNNYQTITGSNSNGLFYTAGAQWTPSRFYSLEAGYGNNAHVTLNISPMQRLSWLTTYRDNSVGTNTGRTWQTALNYRTLRSNWSLAHTNDTTTTQAILLQQQTVTVDINPDPLITQPVRFTVNIPTLTDQVIVRKMWNFNVSFNTGKSIIGAGAFNENRVFQATGAHEKVDGLIANWNWQFSPKTSSYVSSRWQQIDRTSPEKDNRYDFSVGLNRSITQRTNGRLEFSHLNQSSAITTNNFEENRATASLFMRF